MGLSSVEALNDAMFSLYSDDVLAHYGVGADDNPPGRGSGRYPKGSGENPYQHDFSLAKMVSDMRKQGVSEVDIAAGLGFKSTDALRKQLSIQKNLQKKELLELVPEYKERGHSVKEIAEILDISESSVRNYLNPNRNIQVDRTTQVADLLREQLKEKHYIDVGAGTELSFDNVSAERLKTAVQMLQEDGYKVHYVNVEQLGNPGQFTTMKVIGEPGTEWKEVVKDPTLIKTYEDYNDAQLNGESPLGLLPVKSIDSSRVYINYTDSDGKGGAEKDGLVELRPGVEDLSLGRSMYSQVRIGVDGTHYMKGMAWYSDDIPEGYDVIYNTNKKTGTDKYEVFKPMKVNAETGEIDMDNPFGASIKEFKAGGQAYCLDSNGNPTSELRVINKVTDQGDWGDWAKLISPQVLSKQPLPIVRRQLDLTYDDKRAQFDEIMALTNPTLKRKLLESFADDCDASCVHMKAKAFPGQAAYTILPIPSLGGDENYRKKYGVDGEIYAPNFEHGSNLALIRYPHAGTFEIPIVRVNNHNAEALKHIPNAPDAVGINAFIASRLSGADFDGDNVTVIPTKYTDIKSSPALRDLVNFDTKQYKFADPEAPGITSQGKQTEMGKTTNLIADMQIKGATEDEIVRAVKHSMVVIDSEKHHLDWKKSELDNNIQELKEKYQDGGGASTLITRAKSEYRTNKRKTASYVDPETGKKTYGIDPVTGRKVFADANETYMKKNVNKKGEVSYKEVTRQEETTKMAYELETSGDARNLMTSKSQPYPVELVYANYVNKVYGLANEARLAMLNTSRIKRDPVAAKEYASEVDSLDAKLRIAQKNAPKERQATIIALATYKKKLSDNPEIKNDKDRKKRLKGQCMDAARRRVGAKKQRIDITDREWEAIQKGAISDSKLMAILSNTDEDAVKKRATPREVKALSTSQIALAKSMAANGYSIADIAERFGVSASTISRDINAA